MIIVSDTSPITNLIQIEKLDLLKELFQKIIIPVSVFEELSKITDQKVVVEKSAWIEIKAAIDIHGVQLLQNEIDYGEAESIILASELKADFLLIDDLKGRKVAEQKGLKIIGLLGILLKAKKENLIPLIKPVVDSLINIAGFRIHQSLINDLLIAGGEQSEK